MSEFDCYSTWGFKSNPFFVTALRADDQGKRLLVGRDAEVKSIAQKLHKQGKITCLDGHVGVGKTSLVNIAALNCFEGFLKKETHQLLIPCIDSFELRVDESADDFAKRVFLSVAKTLIQKSKEVKGMSIDIREWGQEIDALINSPIISNLELGISNVLSFGVKGQSNKSAAFEGGGIEAIVTSWLKEIFSQRGNGAVICIIDNIELMETAAKARKTQENLRDRLFNIDGLRWVFCGANGVIHSLASSPRLGAFLNEPMQVENIKAEDLESLLDARINEFVGTRDKQYYLPLDIEDIKWLYLVLNNNLRFLLSLCDEYCEKEFEKGKRSETREIKRGRFGKWLNVASLQRYNELSSRLPDSSWQILDAAMTDKFKGNFVGINDLSNLNAQSRGTLKPDQFKAGLAQLQKHGLVSRAIGDEDDGDFKRDVCTVTSKGALVHFARLGKNEQTTYGEIHWLKRVHHQ